MILTQSVYCQSETLILNRLYRSPLGKQTLGLLKSEVFFFEVLLWFCHIGNFARAIHLYSRVRLIFEFQEWAFKLKVIFGHGRRKVHDYFLSMLCKSSILFTEQHIFKIIIYFFNTSKCATNYVISFEIFDGFIGQKILKL